MLSLIKMEFLKLKRRDKYFGIVITCLVFLVLLIPSAVMLHTMYNWQQIMEFNFRCINIIPNIFLCILVGELFVNEYKDKTINIMFSYPLSRTKIYFAKMIVIFFYSFIIASMDIAWLWGMSLLLNKITPIAGIDITLAIIIRGVILTLASILVNTMFTIVYSFFVIVKRSVLFMGISCGVLILIELILLDIQSPFYLNMLLVLGGFSILAVIPIVNTLNNEDVLW